MKFKLLRVGGSAVAQTRRLGSALMNDAYTEEKEIGFIISHITSDVIHGRFLEKKSRRIQIFTVNGETNIVEVPSINIVKFALYTKFKAMVIYEISGSISSFVSRLGSLAEFQLYVELMDVPVQNWIKYLANSGYTLMVKEVTLGRMAIAENVEATIRLRGEVSVELVVSGQYMEKRGDVISAEFHCTAEKSDFIFHWKNTGNYEIEPHPSNEDFIISFLDFCTFSETATDGST